MCNSEVLKLIIHENDELASINCVCLLCSDTFQKEPELQWFHLQVQ